MNVEILLTANEMGEKVLKDKIAVIIDTLRATSTIVTALYNGAVEVKPVEGIEEARRYGSKLKEGSYLLCGERDGVKVEGFTLGNSPLEYTPQRVKGKSIIISTTNGTQAIKRSTVARTILIGSFLNLDVTLEKILEGSNDLVICCSGTKGHFSLEDFVTAGAIISGLTEKGIVICGDDRVQTARLLYERYKDDLVELVSCSQNGIRLVEIGKLKDIEFCVQKNIFPIVCYYDGKIIYT